MKDWHKELALVVSVTLLLLYVHNFDFFKLEAKQAYLKINPIVVTPEDTNG